MALARTHAPLADRLTDAFERLLGSSEFILGSEVAQFEASFAEYCGTAHAIGVNSGTAALTIMLEAAGIGAGDEVIVPAHTFIASALAVIHAGATPVCADVLPDSGLIDPAAVTAAVGPRTAAILAVHLYGQLCDMDALGALAASKGLALFEDAAQAHGAALDGRRAGSFGKAAAFSFYPSKNLGALGDGGAICTDDDTLAATARRLLDLGRERGIHELVGYNERLDGIQAAWLQIKLEYLDGWNADRRSVAAGYRARLDPGLRPLPATADERCVYHLFPIRLTERDVVASELQARGISVGVHYPRALHEQPALPALAGADAPHACDWAAHELSLPIFPEMTEAELDAVATALTEVLASR